MPATETPYPVASALPSNPPTRVLLVEDEPNDAKLIQEALAGSVGRSYLSLIHI